MRRYALCLPIVTLTFALGIASNWLAEKIAEHVNADLDSLEQCAGLGPVMEHFDTGSIRSSSTYAVVCMDRDGNLYLGKENVGTVNDTSTLKQRLRVVLDQGSDEDGANYLSGNCCAACQ